MWEVIVMRIALGLAACCLTAMAWSASPLWAADPKPASKPVAAEKKAAEPPASASPPTQKVKRELLKVELTLKGVFEAKTMTEVVLRPEVWSGLEVVKAVEHGQAVKRGDLLVQCDLTKIDEEIADLRVKTAIAELASKQAEENLRMTEATTPLDLKLAERSRRHADEDLARFLKIDRPMLEKMADYYLKSSEHMLEYEREELRQLEKMYKADELTEETEEIVLRRQRNAVEAAEFMLQRSRVNRDETLQIELPRRQETMEQNSQRQEILAAKSKITLPVALEQQRRDLAKLKLDRAKDDDKLKKLLADREMLTVRAPADGVVYYGQFARGKWSGSEMMAGSLRRGGMITKNAVLMTIVAPRPMFVRATVSEGDLDKIRTGLAATVRPAAYPDLKLAGSVSRIDGIPTASDAFDAQIDVKLDAGDQRATAVVPGMTCTAKLIPYADRRALVVPAKAVFEEELDEDSRFIPFSTGSFCPWRRCACSSGWPWCMPSGMTAFDVGNSSRGASWPRSSMGLRGYGTSQTSRALSRR
jgi:multidrug resistance efflux pump